MRRILLSLLISALAIGLLGASAYAAKPAVPEESTGFVGSLEGTIKEKAPQNAWLVLTVSKAEPEKKSKVKDGSVLAGKDIPVSSRLSGNTPFPEQVAYIETLKVGDKVTLKVRYNDNAGNIAIRLAEVPGGAAPQDATPTKGKTKSAAKSPSGGGGNATAGGKPAVPEEATGFSGSLEGTILRKAPSNGWLVLTVSKAEPDKKSKVKDGSALVGKEIPVSSRLAGNTPFPEQVAYIETLKVGDKVTLKVRYNDNAGNIAIRLAEVPGGAAPQDATPTKGKTKSAAKTRRAAAAMLRRVESLRFLKKRRAFRAAWKEPSCGRRPSNGWLVLTVSKAEPDKKSKVKDGSALVGKEIPVSSRLAGNTPFPEQVAYIETLKVGDKVTLKVRYNDNAGNIAIRLAEVPGGAASQDATPPKGKAKGAAKGAAKAPGGAGPKGPKPPVPEEATGFAGSLEGTIAQEGAVQWLARAHGQQGGAGRQEPGQRRLAAGRQGDSRQLAVGGQHAFPRTGGLHRDAEGRRQGYAQGPLQRQCREHRHPPAGSPRRCSGARGNATQRQGQGRGQKFGGQHRQWPERSQAAGS